MATYTGDNSNNTLSGTNSSDTFHALGGDDLVYGLGGADTIYDGSGNDDIRAGAGNDTIYNEGGSDSYSGGLGRDTLVTDISDTGQFTPRSFEVVFNTVTGVHGRRNSTVGQDTLSGIENFILEGDFNAWVTCRDWANVIRTDMGDDRINTGGGDDRIYSGLGDDIIRGGAGNDVLDPGSGTDFVFGGAGNDRLIQSGSGHQVFDGGNGNDTYFTNLGANDLGGQAVGVNLVTGHSGLWFKAHAHNDEVYNVENVDWRGTAVKMYMVGDDRANVLSTGAKADVLRGGDGDDTLRGNNGGDLLVGGRGKDELRGGKGADTLNGGKGKDAMYAGSDGAEDTFVFAGSTHTARSRVNADRIHEFDSGEDTLDLAGIDADTGTAGNQALSFNAAGAAANSVWVTAAGSHAFVEGDVNGDGTADFRIKMIGITTLDAADFIL